MNKIELPALHKDMYYFGYGIDIEKPIEMANIIIELQQENKILKENAENNDKVVDKVNWENQLLKKENKQLKDNWNKLKNFLKNTRKENLEWDKKHNCEWKGYNAYSELLIKMQELEQGSDE